MPIKFQPSTTIPLLVDYTPYSTNGETLVENINEMFSYSVRETTTPANLQFTFGATNKLVTTFDFKNLTKNTTLELRFDYDTTIFETPNNPITIAPEQTIEVPLNLRINDMEVGVANKLLDFKVSVTNITNNSLVYKSQTESLEIDSIDGVTINVYE